MYERYWNTYIIGGGMLWVGMGGTPAVGTAESSTGGPGGATVGGSAYTNINKLYKVMMATTNSSTTCCMAMGGGRAGGGGFTSTARAVVGGAGLIIETTATEELDPIVVVVVELELSSFLPLLLMYSSTASRISLRMISYGADSKFIYVKRIKNRCHR